MASTSPLQARYWLRTVRVGLLVTALVIGVLIALPFVPHPTEFRLGLYSAVIVAGAAGALVVAALPWKRLFESGIGVLFLYGWSAADIVLVSIGIAATGGGRSNLFLVYVLTTVFFGMAYPVGGQVALLAFTFMCYLVTLAWTGWDVDPSRLLVQLSGLAILTLLSSFLSRELMGQMAAEERSRTDAERWASLLSTVADSARSMTLDPDRVFEVVLDSIMGLGFTRAAVCILDPEGRAYRVVQGRGLPEEYAARLEPAGLALTVLVQRTGASVVVDRDRPTAIDLVQDAGLVSMVASPIWAEGWLQAVLIGGSRDRDVLPAREVEAFELLGAQAGMALQNARQFEAEHQAVERLEELDRMKSDFLATVSHELRTPVTVIQGSGLTLERMWDSLDDDTRRDLLSGLTANAMTLQELITNLLDLSRLQEGMPQMEFAPIDLSAVVRGTAERLSSLFDSRRLKCEIEPDLAVEGDGILLDRVVENLLSNAAKHTPEGTAVSLWARADKGQVVVGVDDEGPGIPADEIAHLGERFFRGGDINTRRRGLGLGLAIVQEILALHGTTLEVESIVGRGSRFSFRLPFLAAEPAVQPDEAPWE